MSTKSPILPPPPSATLKDDNSKTNSAILKENNTTTLFTNVEIRTTLLKTDSGEINNTKPNTTLLTTTTTPKIHITLLPDPSPAHAPALQAWTSLFGAKTSRPHPDQPTFKATYSHPNGRLLLASTPENPVAGLIAYRKYDGRFGHISQLGFLGGNVGGGDGNGDGTYESEDGDGEANRKRDDAGKVVEVVRLFVAPELRNQGIATALVRALVKLAKEDGVGFMYLHTHPFLPGAEKLWEKEGWGVLVKEEEEPWLTIHMGRRV